jgi:hypothetical protein
MTGPDGEPLPRSRPAAAWATVTEIVTVAEPTPPLALTSCRDLLKGVFDLSPDGESRKIYDACKAARAARKAAT